MSEKARTESSGVPFNGWVLIEDTATGAVQKHQVVNGIIPKAGIIRQLIPENSVREPS